MRDISVKYGDRTVTFNEVSEEGRWVLRLKCPKCEKYIVVEPGVFKYQMEAGFGLTIIPPPLVCPHACGFSVMVNNGVMTDV